MIRLLIIGLGCLLCNAEAWGENVLSNQWTIPLPGGSDSAPAVGDDGTIYLGTWRGNLWALRPDGTRKWAFAAENEIKSAPALGPDGAVYFGCRDRKCYALRPDGKERWAFLTRGWVDSSPALAHDGTVYFGSWDQNFYAVNADGSQRWQFGTAGPVVSSPAIGLDGTIYFGSHDKKFYALAPGGSKKWEFTTGGPILSSPALNKDQGLYFTSVDGFLYALKPDGALQWRARTGSTTESSPVLGPDGTIYIGVGEQLWAISAEGKKKWGSVGGDFYRLDPTPLVLAEGVVCCVSRYGLLSYVGFDGAARAMYYLAGYGYGSPAIGPTGDIYVPDNAFGGAGFSALRAGAALAHTPWPRFHGNSRNTGNAQDVAP
jgi:outer membrane protein assembly factor BamB